MRFIAAIAVLVAAMLGASPGHADDWNDCAKARDHAKAIAACTTLIESGDFTGKNLAVVHYNRGVAHYLDKDYDSAIADYTEAIANRPDWPEAYGALGGAHAMKGEYDTAIEHYDQAIELNPDFLAALNNRADAYRQKGEYEKAIADLDRAIELSPDFTEGFFTRGETHLDRGDYDQAEIDINKAIELDPDGKHADFGKSLLAEIDRAKATEKADPPIATGERRVALIIGNGTYKSTGQLPNPGKDADAMAEALRQAGFSTVTVVRDVDRATFVQALKDFSAEADKADWAVVYYAGHGMEVAGTNYLIPVDAKLTDDRDVPDETISLDRVMSAIEGATKLRLVILDACRNNPFLPGMKTSSTTRAVGRGLALVEPSQATLVAFAAKAGSVASDGDDVNSPFAASLAKRVTESGIEINKVFRLVRADVLAATENRQEPFVYGSLPPEDFFFVPPKAQ